MKALITGATGFIGGHLAETLVKRGDSVRCLVRKTSDVTELRRLPVELAEGDITDRESLDRSVGEVDVIYHLGGITKAKTEAAYFKINADGSRLLYEACLANNPHVAKIVHVSSLAAAGPAEPGRPLTEDDPARPITSYGKSKWEGEKYAHEYSKHLPVTVIRPPAVYGPREKDILIYFQLIHRHVRPVLGLRKKYLSMIYSDDLVEAIVRAGDDPASAGQTYFVDDGQIYTWQDISDILSRVMDRWTIPLFVPEFAVHGVGLTVEFFSRWSKNAPVLNRQKIIELKQSAWTCSSEKIRRELGFQPKFQFEQGAKLTAEWYRRAGWL